MMEPVVLPEKELEKPDFGDWAAQGESRTRNNLVKSIFLDAAQQEVQILTSNYQTEQIFLSADMKKKREDEILEKERYVLELKRKYFGEDGEWYKKRESLLKPIQEEIYNAVQEIATEKKYDVVKDRSADPRLIYMSSRLDISDQVLEKLGAK